MSNGYTVVSSVKPKRIPRIGGANQIKHVRSIQTTEVKKMKKTFKQRLRKWLMDETEDNDCYVTADTEGPNIQSQGFRLNIYGAGGGTIIETTKYDRKNDENRHSLHVVTDDKDLGQELSKIITLEQLR